MAVLEKKVDPPSGPRGIVFKLVNHRVFDVTITFFIIFNTVMMAAKHDGMDPKVVTFFAQLNYLFAFVFNIEMILKLIGLDK